jgi:hypothetical protein
MLKYLFTAQYLDGSVFAQNPEDVSSVDPKRSAFYDVDHSKLAIFYLVSSNNVYSVNLIDGHFEVNGVPFRLHDDPELKDFRLIFFRQHTHNYNIITKEELSHEIVYKLGWQTTKEGKNIQHVIEFD